MTVLRGLRLSLAILAVGVAAFWSTPVAADPPDIGGQAGSDAYEIVGEQANDAGEGTATNDQIDNSESATHLESRWVSVCTTFDDVSTGSNVLDCAAARSCANSAERLWRLWGRSPESGPGWQPMGSECFGQPPTAADIPQARVTPALVLNAIRRIGLPELTAQTQPTDKTLVNFATL